MTLIRKQHLKAKGADCYRTSALPSTTLDQGFGLRDSTVLVGQEGALLRLH